MGLSTKGGGVGILQHGIGIVRSIIFYGKGEGGGEMYIKENEGETYITDGERKRMSIKVKGGM